MPGYLGFFQMPGYLGYLPNAKVFGKFLKYPIIWEIFKILKICPPQIFKGILEILGIPQIPGNLTNFPNALVLGKFHNCLGVREIPQISNYLGNFQNLKNIPPSNFYWNERIKTSSN